MTVSAEMVLPAALGYWLDEKLGTTLVLTVLGALAGFALGFWHLLRMTSKPTPRTVEQSHLDKNHNHPS
jgi:hypothetical protein